MGINYDRRQFLRVSHSKDTPIRPPYNGGEQHFIDHCTRCSKCVETCETQIITIGSGGLPQVNFAAQECTFCELCSDICPTDALDKNKYEAFHTAVNINKSCFASNDIYCQSCRDVCDESAIKFDFFSERIPTPTIVHDACSGCGACVSVCPPNAINITITKERCDE